MHESISVFYESSLSFESESCFCLLELFWLFCSEEEEEDDENLLTIIVIAIAMIMNDIIPTIIIKIKIK